MKEVKFFCFQKFGHYTRDYYFNKESKENDKRVAQFAHAGSIDLKEVILMADTQLDQEKTNVWFIILDGSLKRSIMITYYIMVA